MYLLHESFRYAIILLYRGIFPMPPDIIILLFFFFFYDTRKNTRADEGRGIRCSRSGMIIKTPGTGPGVGSCRRRWRRRKVRRRSNVTLQYRPARSMYFFCFFPPPSTCFTSNTLNQKKKKHFAVASRRKREKNKSRIILIFTITLAPPVC